jgi:acyl dehydratase
MSTPPRHIPSLSALPALVGTQLGHSDWVLVDQARIDAFAAATGDAQWIHVDPTRAASGPFGMTIAHGFLTLSLLPVFMNQAFAIDGMGMGVNYGLNRVRFPAPVPVGSRLRGTVKLLACEPLPQDGLQAVLEVSVEREGGSKPVCVAESVVRFFP